MAVEVGGVDGEIVPVGEVSVAWVGGACFVSFCAEFGVVRALAVGCGGVVDGR